MKKIYFLKSILLLLCMAMGVNAWGEEVPYYTLDGTITTGGNSNYAQDGGGLTQDNISWSVTGNTTINPWRIGGKNLTDVDREVYTKTAMDVAINKIELELGDLTLTSLNSVQLIIASDVAFTSKIDEINVGTSKNTTHTITPTSSLTQWPKNAYYKFVFNVTAGSSNSYIQLKSIKFYEAVGVTHTLSSAVSPTESGTVELGASTIGETKTTTITATPNDGYRFANWTVTGTGSFVETATAASTTFTMGTEDATITACFELIPSHTISAIATPAAGGTIELGATSVREGATTTATASANAGYKFTSWSITGTGAELSSTTDNPVTISMGTADAEITANFAAVVTHAINWSINGVIAKTDNVEENTAIDFYTPTSGIPVGYTFIGWSETEILSAQDTKPTLVNSATSITDKTYYAVIAVGQDAPATLTKMTSTDTFYDGDQIVIVANNDGTDYALYQELINKSYVNKWEFDGQVKTVASDNKNWITVTEKDGKWILGDATNGYLKNSSNELYLDTNIDNAASFTLAYSAEESGFYLKTSEGRWLAYRSDLTNKYYRMGGNSTTPNGVAYFDLYKYETDNVTYSNYCTSITSIPITIGTAGYATLHPEFAVEADEVQMFTVSKATASEITLTEVLAAKANMPVILKGSAGTYYLPITTDDDAEDVIGTADNDNLLTYGTLSANDYVLYNGDDGVGFYQWVGSDVENRVFLPATKVPSGAKFLAFSFNEETGIEKISMAADKEEEAKWFNLAGQRVAQPTKGMYIVRGKKVVVK